jgi:hypothetical protein
MKRFPAVALLPAVLSIALAGCEAQKSSNPLSPAVAGPIAGVEITSPRLVEPGQGFKYKESQQPIRLVIENATSSGVRPVSYMFEVASDADFNSKVFARSNVPAGEGGRTSVQVDRLDLGRAYYWRARADDGANSSQFTSAQFEVLPKPVLSAPGLVSPINNDRVLSKRPPLVVGASNRNAAIGRLEYEFQVAIDQAFAQLVAAGMVPETGGQTTFVPNGDLPVDRQHFWRVRATDGESTSAWASTQTFRTPQAPSPGPTPGPAPPPGNGGSCASSDGPAIVACIAAKYPGYRTPVGSLGQRQANMEFLRDRIIEAGKCGGLDLGHNLKRGGPETSIDFLAHRRAGGEMGVDLGYDYDNISTTLQLQWSEAGFGATYKAYPNTGCQ